MEKHKIYYFNQQHFQQLSSNPVETLEDAKKVIDAHHLKIIDYYFISTIEPISEQPFSGYNEELTHIYLRKQKRMILLEELKKFFEN